MDLDLSLNSILCGLIFSSVGIYYFRKGKREGIMPLVVIGIAMMMYSYFISKPALNWIIGIGLWVWAYTF